MSEARGVSRVLSKLKKSVEEGQYYEAHQMYRTLYFRYLTQKRFAELVELLYDGSYLLLSHGQMTSGADLALLLLEVLQKSQAKPTETNIEKVINLFRILKDPERQQYLVRAVKWSSNEHCTLGNPTLHQQLAIVLWKEKRYSMARYHFLRSDDGGGCATLLIEIHKLKGYPSEIDLFVAQAVLQYLCLRKKSEASEVFQTYTSSHPDISKSDARPPYLLPLLNFIWFLLLAVEKGKVAEFTILCEQYRPSIQRDPYYREYLDRIGQLFFKLPPPPPQTGSLFGSMIQSLFGASNEEEDEGDFAQPLASEDLD